MWRSTAALSLLLFGCASAADDSAPPEDTSANPTGAGTGGTVQSSGAAGAGSGTAGTSSGSGNGGTGGNSAMTSGAGGSAGGAGKGGGMAGGGAGQGGTMAVVTVGQVGVWENVTPAGVSIDPNYVPATNFGVMDAVADPVRPSDFYIFICYQGVWRSTDFGVTWKKVSTGTNGSVLQTGRPWTAAIDNDKKRDPMTAPALYTANGYGSQSGVFKSTDWGVSWSRYFEGNDIYSLSMDPYDNKHLITGLHEGPGIAETVDAGLTWRTLPTGNIGRSIYPHFIDTGTAATTRKTWLAVPQMDTGDGAAMTTDGGATFHTVGTFAHPHGGNQLFNAGAGTSYVGASGGGVWRTTDAGTTWKALAGSSDNGYANGVIGTPNWLYAWDDGANAGGIGSPHLAKAPRNPGTAWTQVTAPVAMNNGGKTIALTYDGMHYILVSGSWNAGIWRYVEP